MITSQVETAAGRRLGPRRLEWTIIIITIFSLLVPLTLIPTKDDSGIAKHYLLKGSAIEPKNNATTIQTQTTTTNQASASAAWCPHAACNDSALCQPCKQRFLFIISAGRAASTSLLGMVNLLPNVSNQQQCVKGSQHIVPQ